MAVRAFFVQNVRGDMKKNLALVLFSFLLYSCAEFSFNRVETKIVETPEIDVPKFKTSEEFVQGSEDIPLLVGMTKIFEESLGFDSSAGSIMASSYETKDSLADVKEFYSSSLPEFGWKIIKNDSGKMTLKREKEKLEIEFLFENNKKIIRFFLSSAV